MKRITSLFVACLISVAGIADAQTITIDLGGTPQVITLSTGQFTALQSQLQATLNDPARVGQTPATLNRWVQLLVVTLLRSQYDLHRQRRAAEACASYSALSVVDQQIILDKLGGKSPCATADTAEVEP